MKNSKIEDEITFKLRRAESIAKRLIDAGDNRNDCIKTLVMIGREIYRIYPQHRQLIISETKRAVLMLAQYRKLKVS